MVSGGREFPDRVHSSVLSRDMGIRKRGRLAAVHEASVDLARQRGRENKEPQKKAEKAKAASHRAEVFFESEMERR
eukprot:2382809-Pleurochrysis_carterae.AAC.1